MFNDVADFVILVSAFAVAIVKIYDFFAKPTSYFKKRAKEAEKQRI